MNFARWVTIQVCLVSSLFSFGGCASKAIDAESRGIASTVNSAPECGTTQKTISDRIADCARFTESSRTSKAGILWRLVARKVSSTEADVEVWQDSKNGLIWSDVLKGNNPRLSGFYDAKGYYAGRLSYSVSLKLRPREKCKISQVSENSKTLDCPVLQETACQSERGALAAAGIQEVKFGIPSALEALNSVQDGMPEILPNYDRIFWTRSKNLSHSDDIESNYIEFYIFGLADSERQRIYGYKYEFRLNYAGENNYVRCVAQQL